MLARLLGFEVWIGSKVCLVGGDGAARKTLRDLRRLGRSVNSPETTRKGKLLYPSERHHRSPHLALPDGTGEFQGAFSVHLRYVSLARVVNGYIAKIEFFFSSTLCKLWCNITERQGSEGCTTDGLTFTAQTVLGKYFCAIAVTVPSSN